jgi:hypothetical protein
MSAYNRPLRLGQELLVQSLDPSPLLAPFPVRVSVINSEAITLTLLAPRRHSGIPRGRELRLSGGGDSGVWNIRVRVVSPLLLGRAWFVVSVITVEELVQRRQEPRLRIQMPLRIRTECEVSPVEFVARCEDLSLGGMCLESRHALAPDSLLALTLHLDTGATLTVRGVVAWSTKSRREEGRFLVGVRFLEVPPLPRLALARFLANKRRELERR